MVWLLRRCDECKRYTLKLERCPYCGSPVHVPHPAKFSPDDRYEKYRWAMRRISEKGLLKSED